MSEIAVAPHLLSQKKPLGVSWGKLMMWLFLGSDAMGFGGFLCAYAMLRQADPTWPIPSQILGIQFTAVMTFVLICSSVTMVKSFEAILRNDRRACHQWLLATLYGGLLFLAGQAYEYTHLAEHGFVMSASNMAATFFITTGFHGLHVFGGVVLLAIGVAKASSGWLTPERASVVENIGLYWHFVDLIWILVFTFIYLL